jgi:hypothetical protein
MNKSFVGLIAAAILCGCYTGTEDTLDQTAMIDPQAACFKNLHAIDRAVQMSAMDANLRLGERPSPEMFAMYLAGESGSTNCPSGGTYSFGLVGTKPGCSMHGTFPKH